MAKKVTVIGRGLDPSRHVNLAAIEAMKISDVVTGVEFDLDSWKTICTRFGLPEIDHSPFTYQSDAKDTDNYQAYVEKILTLIERCNHVSILVSGHPRLGVTLCSLLEKEALVHGFELDFIPNVSSFDIMINDLKFDPLERGTAIIDSNRLLLFENVLDSGFNYFLYHVSSVGTSRTNFRCPEESNDASLLLDYLLRFYSPDHIVTICKAASDARKSNEYIPIKLGQLATASSQICYSSTLFIPAARPKTINRDFLKRLQGA
jgi:uncharacterized protein YabN with tetrapyrrole methylase and pyrophosphatase domain